MIAAFKLNLVTCINKNIVLFCGPLKQVKLGDNDIKFVEKSKCLGMILDSQLSWKLQKEKVKTDMSQGLRRRGGGAGGPWPLHFLQKKCNFEIC